MKYLNGGTTNCICFIQVTYFALKKYVSFIFRNVDKIVSESSTTKLKWIMYHEETAHNRLTYIES